MKCQDLFYQDGLKKPVICCLLNSPPVWEGSSIIQIHEKILMQFVDNTGPDQLAQLSLSAYRINGYCNIC